MDQNILKTRMFSLYVIHCVGTYKKTDEARTVTIKTLVVNMVYLFLLGLNAQYQFISM